jgi:hypothetical protein
LKNLVIRYTETDFMPPLNGKNFHPLSTHAQEILRTIYRRPLPVQEVNAGVVARLVGDGLAERIPKTSPYKKHNGGTCEHLFITAKGRMELGV